MLQLSDLHFSYVRSGQAREVLSGTSMQLEEGSINGLIGPSGQGKSTLLKIIAGLLELESGQMQVDQTQVALMFQEGALFDSLNVLDNVAFPLAHGEVPTQLLSSPQREEIQETSYQILKRVGLKDAIYKLPGQLSGGMRRRASLARALVSKPAIALLDDPTAGLDPVASNVILNLILEMHSEYNPTIILVSHDLRRLLPRVQKIWALFDGKIGFSGSLEELRQLPESPIRHFVSCRFEL